MDPVWILLLGMAVVVCGVLMMRMPAFLALLCGAFLVALLTPREAIYDHELRTVGLRIDKIDSSGEIRWRPARNQSPLPGQQWVYRPQPQSTQLIPVGTAELEVPEDRAMPVARVRPLDDLVVQAGDYLVHPRLAAQAEGIATRTVGNRIAEGFGDTCTKIGLLVAMAALIGTALLESGAAERIVMATHRLLGDRRASWAFLTSGFVVGIPVFFDTVFYLLMPLAKAMRLRTGGNYLLYLLSVIAGATMAHSLVPPTPGPLFVASELEISVGLMMLGGTGVGGIAVLGGYLYALWANQRWEIPLRGMEDSPEPPLAPAATPPVRPLPALWLSLLPILLPVGLLGGNTILQLSGTSPGDWPTDSWIARLEPAWRTLGDKNVALAVATLVALATMVAYSSQRETIPARIQAALSSAGSIILITAAGGAFGHVLRQTGIAAALQHYLPAQAGGQWLLLMAFGVTAVVRIAQGSATVAMITAVGIVAPLAASMSLPFHPLYLALAIGCGSKPMPWMNDSGFWVVGRMSGMTEAETLKSFSVLLTVMGLIGISVTMLAALWLPLV